MKGFIKVPFRQIYCEGVWNWIRRTFWVHVVIRVFPDAVDMASMPNFCLDDPKQFLEQYEFMFKRIREARGRV